MDPEPLPPIPTPPRQWWMLFCQRALPLATFAGALFATVILWNHAGVGRSFVAIGDGTRTHVLAPQAGTLVEMLVPPYSVVRQGTPLALLREFDPRAALDRTRLRMDAARLQALPTLAQNRAVDLERIRLDLARIRSELATARVRHEFASREVDRLEPLFRDRLIAENTFEISRAARDMNAAEVQEKERLMQDVQARLQTLEGGATPDSTATPDSGFDFDFDFDTLEDPGPVTTLTAPIDGVVGPWLRHPGEFVVEGEPLLAVLAPRAERLVGYLRQPVGFDPQAGMPVRVTRRSIERQQLQSTIRHVGSQFETITNALALVRDGVLMDIGLPVVVDLPAEHSIRPGEIVDIVVDASSASAPLRHLAP